MSVIIRLQNLPWSANAADIRAYFNGLSIPEGGVHIVGGEQGDAFIAFSTDEDARQAMLLDGGKLKEVKIKLMLSSRTEMLRVIEVARQQSMALQNLITRSVPTPTMVPHPSQTQQPLQPTVPLSMPSTPIESEAMLPIDGAREEDPTRPKSDDTDKGRRRSTSRDRGRSRGNDRDRDKERDRSRGRYNSSRRSRRDRSRSRDRYRRRSKSRDRSRDKGRRSSRDRSRRKSLEKENSKENPFSGNSIAGETNPQSGPAWEPAMTTMKVPQPPQMKPVLPPNQLQPPMKPSDSMPPMNLPAGLNDGMPQMLPPGNQPMGKDMPFQGQIPGPMFIPPAISQAGPVPPSMENDKNSLNPMQTGYGMAPMMPNPYMAPMMREGWSMPMMPPEMSQMPQFPPYPGMAPGMAPMPNPWGMMNPGQMNALPTASPSMDESENSVEIRGLPLTASYIDVKKLFDGLSIPSDGIKMINDNHGNRTGIAYVHFTQPADKISALNQNGKKVRGNVVEVLHLQESIYKKAIDNYKPDKDAANATSGTILDKEPDRDDSKSKRYHDPRTAGRDNKISREPWKPREREGKPRERVSRFSSIDEPKRELPTTNPATASPSQASSNCVILENLPPEVTRNDLFDFFSESGLAPNFIHLITDNVGQSTGKAICQFSAQGSPEKAIAKDQSMMGRYIVSVKPATVEDVEKFRRGSREPWEGFLPLTPLNNFRGQMTGRFNENQGYHVEGFDRPNNDRFRNKREEFGMMDHDRRGFDRLKDDGPDNGHIDNERIGGNRLDNDMFNRGNGGGFNNWNDRFNKGCMQERLSPGSGFGGDSFEKRPNFSGRMNSGMMERGGRGGRGGRPPFRGPGRPNREPSPFVDEPSIENFGEPGCVVAMENIHFRAEVDEIIDFFDGFDIETEDIIRRFDDRGRATGDARVAMKSPADALRAVRTLNFKTIRGRPVKLSIV